MTQIIDENSEIHAPESSAPPRSAPAADGISTAAAAASMPPPLPAQLQDLTERARGGYVEAASSANTRKAYASDWKHFAAWCRCQNLVPLPPDPAIVGLYITACASGSAAGAIGPGRKANSVSTIERRLAAIGWSCAQRGMPLNRKDRRSPP